MVGETSVRVTFLLPVWNLCLKYNMLISVILLVQVKSVTDLVKLIKYSFVGLKIHNITYPRLRGIAISDNIPLGQPIETSPHMRDTVFL